MAKTKKATAAETTAETIPAPKKKKKRAAKKKQHTPAQAAGAHGWPVKILRDESK